MKNNIKVQRAIFNLTQQDLADRIGVSRQTINAMEAGKFVPSTVLALKISRLFEKPVNEIFELGEED
ncbi:helix-turn-helix transcriptional regulator [Flavobacterium sp. AG291]|uniref:helix-turn-helix transcriptional regulator n=1 Tax=Flavobacterium sp. AG291 TaxID=2184000 RepID=UPI000E0B18A5|nr:helix-turn-helix transcriptional regulator [Flavobacterium sp. AG291]RDI08475.1 putative transcriptional regulator [Flavobacterium sp. AG291]